MQQVKFLAIFAAVFLSSCATSQDYRYKPIENEHLVVGDQKGAIYKIPSPEKPEGEVRILSYGVTDLGKYRDLPDIRTMHVRMTIKNQQTKNWSLIAGDQILILPREGRSRPAYANTDVDQKKLPEVIVKPGEQRVVDLYYPLPQGMKKAEEIPNFQFQWDLVTPRQKIVETTPFDRFKISPLVPKVYPYAAAIRDPSFGLGWSHNWWHDHDYARWIWYDPDKGLPQS
jgi:hypothetical protein